MRKYFLSFGLLLTVGLATTVFNSCKDDEGKSNSAIQVKNKQDLTQTLYADTKESKNINITTTGAWTSTIKTTAVPAAVSFSTSNVANWISISPDHGDEAGDYTIQISLEINATGVDRTAQIVILCNGTEITITITQSGITKDGEVPIIPSDSTEMNTLYIALDKEEYIVGENAIVTITTSFEPLKKVELWSKSGLLLKYLDFTATTDTTYVVNILNLSHEMYQLRVETEFSVAFKIINVILDPFTDEGVIINGVKWATRNLLGYGYSGRFAATPESYGQDFYWDWAQDACPAGWRLPTYSELQSLVNSGGKWESINGVNGFIFGSGDNTLFLPAAGFRESTITFHSLGIAGNYWSSTIVGDGAYYFHFDEQNTFITGSNYRIVSGTGCSVRCVAK